MPLVVRPFPSALPHGDLDEVLPGIFFVTGTIAMPGAMPIRFSRNMTVIREGERLVIVNSVRLDDRGLAALDALGKVTDVIRIAGNHGMDDPFYKDRYGARVWVVKGQRYTSGFNTSSPDTYFTPDIEMDASTALPLAGASLYVIGSNPPEALLTFERDSGIVISGDCLQHWATTDQYFSFMARPALRIMGFIRPHNIGPGWVKNCHPPKEHLRGILGLKFANVLPAHGAPVLGGAREHYQSALERVS